MGDADRVHMREGTAGIRRKAPAEDRANVAIFRRFQHAFLIAAGAFDKLAIEEAFLHRFDIGLIVGAGEEVGNARPQHLLAAFGIVVPALAIFAAETVAFDHLRHDVVGTLHDIGVAQFLLRGRHDFIAKLDRDFVADRERADRHAKLLAGIFDERRVDPLGDQFGAFLYIGAEAARGVEATAVIDDDRRLFDLGDEIECLGNGGRASFFAEDDFHQRHFFDRREEMDADEIGGLGPGGRQLGDRQGGSVGAEDDVWTEDRFDLFGDFGLDRYILEYRFDHEVRTGEIGIVGGGGYAGERCRHFLRRHAFAQALLEHRFDMGLALFRIGDVTVEQHDLHPRLRGDGGDASAHHARAEHGELRGGHLGFSLGTARAAFGSLFVDEQAADHVACLRIGGDPGEIFAFDADCAVEGELRAFIDGREQGDRRVHVALGLLEGHGQRADHRLDEAGVELTDAAGEFEALDVPGLGVGGGVGLHPFACCLDCRALRHDLIHHL